MKISRLGATTLAIALLPLTGCGQAVDSLEQDGGSHSQPPDCLFLVDRDAPADVDGVGTSVADIGALEYLL